MVDGGQGLFWPGAHGDVVGQIDPPHRARGVDVKLRRARDIFSFWTRARVENIVSLDNGGIGIGKKRKGISHLFGMSAAGLARIDTDRDDLNST